MIRKMSALKRVLVKVVRQLNEELQLTLLVTIPENKKLSTTMWLCYEKVNRDHISTQVFYLLSLSGQALK